jgi:hypothetical protein
VCDLSVLLTSIPPALCTVSPLVQVDTLKYRLLSDPFTLLTLDINAAVKDALARLDRVREEVKAATQAAADASDSAAANSCTAEVHHANQLQGEQVTAVQTAGQDGFHKSEEVPQAQGPVAEEKEVEPLVTLPPSVLQRLLLKQKGRHFMPGNAQWRGRATARATQGGELHAVVVWVEAELAPGVVISCAPHQLQNQAQLQGGYMNGSGTGSPSIVRVQEGASASPTHGNAPANNGVLPHAQSPYLSPHVWQMVHFIPVPVTLTAGQVRLCRAGACSWVKGSVSCPSCRKAV